jgi:4-amino-4-deoxy-L-arabinose transferase-like glycosyltransferase
MANLWIVWTCIHSHFPVADEIAHLPSGISHWEFGRFDLYRVNPPLVRVIATTPILQDLPEYDWSLYTTRVGTRPEFTLGKDLLFREKLAIHEHFILPRLLCSVFPIALLVSCYTWSLRVFGRTTAMLVLLCLSFSPALIASSFTMVPDYGGVLFGLLATYATWKYLNSPDLAKALTSGVFVGLACLSKLTWITLFASIPLTIWLCLNLPRAQFPERKRMHRFGDLLAWGCLSVFVINAGYLFEDTFEPLGEYSFCSNYFGGSQADRFLHGNRFEGSLLGGFPAPVPKNLVLGVDYLKHEVESKKWSFLNGEWKFGSWPSYYAFTTLYKTPEPTLFAACLGLIAFVVSIIRKQASAEMISMVLLLMIPAVICFVSVSLQGGFNHHHRYVLMIYPPMFVLAGFLGSPVAERAFTCRNGLKALHRIRHRNQIEPNPLFGSEETANRPTASSWIHNSFNAALHWHWTRKVSVLLIAASVALALRVHPHYTTYFNFSSGGPENGWRLLGFSNVDWGQDLLKVNKWIREHPDCRPLRFDLDYFEMNGELFGMPASSPPILPKYASIDEVRRSITETQWWIISVKKLYNYPGHKGLEYLQQIEPVDKIAFSYHVYRVDPLADDSEDQH